MESFGSEVKDFGSSLQHLVKSEIRLAAAEIKDNASRFGRHVGLTAGFLVFAFLGVFPFMAFLVMGLGELLNGNYWLSSLIVAAVYVAVGAPLAMFFYRKLKRDELNLPRTTKTLLEDKQIIADKVHDMFKTRRREGSI